MDTQYNYISLYRALFAISYYGMMRVSEVTMSDHVAKARDVHCVQNKDKIMVKLYTSKTHNRGTRPQIIKITSNITEKSGFYARRNFCPFKLVKEYIHQRGHYSSPEDQFFVFKDRSPVNPASVRQVLKTCLKNIGLDTLMYGFHSFRVGRTTNLIKYNYSIEEVKRMGRWHSNTV